MVCRGSFYVNLVFSQSAYQSFFEIWLYLKFALNSVHISCEVLGVKMERQTCLQFTIKFRLLFLKNAYHSLCKQIFLVLFPKQFSSK